MHRKLAFGALAVVALVPLLIAASGGFPSRPIFQTVRANAPVAFNPNTLPISVQSASPGLAWLETDAAADSKLWLQRVNSNTMSLETRTDSGSGGLSVWTAARTGTTVDSFNIFAAAVNNNSVSMTPETGSISATLTTGCTTTPAWALRYYRIGNAVTLSSNSVFNCTSNSISTIFSAALPASLRPASLRCASAGHGSSGAGDSTTTLDISTGGNLTFTYGIDGGTGNCGGNSWSATGNKLLRGFSVSYTLN